MGHSSAPDNAAEKLVLNFKPIFLRISFSRNVPSNAWKGSKTKQILKTVLNCFVGARKRN